MSKIDDLEKILMNAVAQVATYHRSSLGTGDSIDQIPEAVIRLRHAARFDFVERYAAVSEVFHSNWRRRVGTPGYYKPLWMTIDNALSGYALEIATSIGFEGPWVPVCRAKVAGDGGPCTWLLAFHAQDGQLLGHAISRAENARDAVQDSIDRGVNPGGVCSFKAIEDDVLIRLLTGSNVV